MSVRSTILVAMSLHPGARSSLEELGNVSRVASDRAQLVDQFGACEALLTYVPPADLLGLLPAPRLRVIACHACPERVRVAAAEHGVEVFESPTMRETVADHTVGLLLAAARQLPGADAAVRAGRWESEDLKVPYSGHDVFGRTVGIIGLGRIGQLVARRLRGFETRISYYDLERRTELEDESLTFAALEDLMSQSDFVVVQVPLDDRTRGLISERLLRAMKPTAILVNTSRGAVIDQDALIDALASSRIAGAALDVFVDEPLRAGHPLVHLDNVVLTPHLGGSTLECDQGLVDAARRVLTG